MDIKEATDILEILANGIEPSSGNKIPAGSPYNSPDVIRALYTCINYIKHPPKRQRKSVEEKRAENIKKGLPQNSGMPWTEDLKMDLVSQFKSGIQPNALSRKFERTRGAIISELKKLGEITEEQAVELSNSSK